MTAFAFPDGGVNVTVQSVSNGLELPSSAEREISWTPNFTAVSSSCVKFAAQAGKDRRSKAIVPVDTSSPDAAQQCKTRRGFDQ